LRKIKPEVIPRGGRFKGKHRGGNRGKGSTQMWGTVRTTKRRGEKKKLAGQDSKNFHKKKGWRSGEKIDAGRCG